MDNIYTKLNPENAWIWRIVHRDNLPWILDNGLHCANSGILAPNFVNIGNTELIEKRRQRVIPIPPGGTLADYVPFYFTPFSVMMFNIYSGRSVQQRRNEEIVIVVSSLHHVQSIGLSFVFTNAHAYPVCTNYHNDLAHLNKIDWGILQNRDFKRDPDDPEKMERYQAEALIFRHLPVQGILGIVCYTDRMKNSIEQQVGARALTVPVHARTGWYF